MIKVKINGEIQELDIKTKEAIKAVSVSAAKILANTLIKEGVATEILSTKAYDDGFYVEFKSETQVSNKQLLVLENKTRKLATKTSNSNEYPVSPTLIKFIKLRGLGGIEGEGIRIFGFASSNKQQFDEKVSDFKDRDERDHRKIGDEMELFFFDQEVSRGFPFWLPSGKILKDTISEWIKKQELKYGSVRVQTPIIGSSNLYKTSGHYDHYKNGMFPEMDFHQETGETQFVRPMSCPHHVTIFKHRPRSYKELPLRLAEDVLQYRYEKSGSLLGLERVRGMELTDSHVFLRPDQLEQEINTGFEIIMTTLEKFNIEIDYIELACHDPEDKEKYHSDKKMWKATEEALEKFLIDNNVKYKKMIGEAAFYGPKIDVQIKTALGHNITVSTIQLDNHLPNVFKLEYIDNNGEKQVPIMIHRGHIGTYERFISVLLEQTKGDLPMWLAPRQSVVIPISAQHHGEYARKIFHTLIDAGVRVEMDDSENRLGQKIRVYQTQKVKTQIIIGDEERDNETVTFRYYGSEESQTMTLEELINIYKEAQ